MAVPGIPAAPYALRFGSGRVCLDLLATAHPMERLGEVEVLRAWIAGSGLVPAGTSLAHAEAGWVAGFREVRGVVGVLVDAHLAGRPPRDGPLALLNALARPSPPAPSAVLAADGTLVPTLEDRPECAGLIGAVARDAVELLTDPVARAALRRCAGDNCPIVYVDTSRGRRRRWCSSEVCGNRERVARHRRRAAALTRA
ncbi:CGNR zinc finger domain-containing protein [Streptomyces sp. enrichment culture]|uniref:CGNR zinc finger domain-containing protein n=1 Tax=Streptomyces sp. enrichment culture TaxID=1795815 RepID=UPI003F562DF1